MPIKQTMSGKINLRRRRSTNIKKIKMRDLAAGPVEILTVRVL